MSHIYYRYSLFSDPMSCVTSRGVYRAADMGGGRTREFSVETPVQMPTQQRIGGSSPGVSRKSPYTLNWEYLDTFYKEINMHFFVFFCFFF